MTRAVVGALLAAAVVGAVCAAPAVGTKAAATDDNATVRALLLTGADLPAGFKDEGTVTSSGCFSPAGRP